MKYQKMKALICGCMVGMMVFTGCTNTQENVETTSTNNQTEEMKAETDIFAMDTFMTITAYGPEAQEAVDAAKSEISRLDGLFSASNPEGEVGQINENGGGICSEDTAYLMERSLELNQNTNGAFNVMIYPILEEWGFINKEYAVPSQETLDALMPLTDISKVTYDSNKKEVKFLQDGMKIDFGGIAKGYTSTKVMNMFDDYNIKSAILNLGGNVQVKGTKMDGTDWRVGIQDPEDLGEMLGVLEVHDKAVITSGGYERYFEQDGEIYHHILDPATGRTAKNGLISVTIVSEDGALADGLSTSLFVMGKEKAEQFWKDHSDQFETILVADDGEIYITEGIADQFTPEKKEVHVIEKA